jgi:pectin methylesterase-like acyl-CoA thioesterase
VSPQKWRAFVIVLSISAIEFPGAVHYLADSLSQEGLSILHISTFESEVFLVQEQDIEKACNVFRRSESPSKLAGLKQNAMKIHLNNNNVKGGDNQEVDSER